MKIVIFSGTTEGRELSEYLTKKRIEHIVCVATQSGESVMEKSDFAKVRIGRMDRDEMTAFLNDTAPKLVIDATHPYAQVVTAQLEQVCGDLRMKYVRVSRNCEYSTVNVGENTYFYSEAKACAEALEQTEGNILLTTGSKELVCYTQSPKLRKRIYVRVLPTAEALQLCSQAMVDEKHIIAMYGPHTEQMNMAIMEQYHIAHMVTKESGKTGGCDEKILAARKQNVTIHILKRPETAEGLSVEACMQMLDEVCEAEEKAVVDSKVTDQKVENPKAIDSKVTDLKGVGQITTQGLQVRLVGIGMGTEESLTVGVKKAMDGADYVFGAARMLSAYTGSAQTKAIYMAEEIIAELEKIRFGNVVILFSGDVGVYSGATKLYARLLEWGRCDLLEMMPGISTFSAFAAALGMDYTGARLESLHGKSQDLDHRKKIAGLIEHGERVFLLMSGKADFEILYGLISESVQSKMKIDIGYNISYPDQRLYHTDYAGLPDLMKDMSEGLYIVQIRNL